MKLATYRHNKSDAIKAAQSDTCFDKSTVRTVYPFCFQ